MTSPFIRPGPRRGLSLTEILIAIFVMAIGMISLLVLFPLGLSNMRWAIQDNRVAQATNNALALAEQQTIATGWDPARGPPSLLNQYTLSCSLRTDPMYYIGTHGITQLFDTAVLPAGQWRFDTDNGPFPPFFVDPIHVHRWPSTFPNNMGVGFSFGWALPPVNANIPVDPRLYGPPARPSLGIPRINASITPTINDAVRLCMLEDDMTFAPDGTVLNPTGTPPYATIERERRYSWGYMCRRAKGNDAAVTDMTVVIYSGRTLAGTSPTTPPIDPRYQAVVLQNATTMTVRKTAGQPWPLPVKRGDWVLDNTLIMPTAARDPTVPGRILYGPFRSKLGQANVLYGNPGPNGPFFATVQAGLANGYFYRIINISDPEADTAGEVQYVEIDRPARADGVDVVFPVGVVDVIEKSNGRMPAR